MERTIGLSNDTYESARRFKDFKKVASGSKKKKKKQKKKSKKQKKKRKTRRKRKKKEKKREKKKSLRVFCVWLKSDRVLSLF